MSIEGKYLAGWVRETVIREAFGVLQGDLPQGIWLIVGRVQYETPGLGVWVVVEDVQKPDGKAWGEFDKGVGATLFRWSWIAGAVLADKKSEAKAMGFQPR